MQLTAISERTGTQSILISVRSSSEQYNAPFLFYTDKRLADFFALTTTTTAADIAVRLDAFLLSGVDGVVPNYAQHIVNLKKQAASLIFSKCRESFLLFDVEYEHIVLVILPVAGCLPELTVEHVRGDDFLVPALEVLALSTQL